MQNYDVIIIGAGPAGLFASYYLLQHTDAHVLLIDKGWEMQSRRCAHNCDACTDCDRCSVLCGVGGAGLFSDGKLILDLNAGGLLDSVSHITDAKKKTLTNYIECTLRGFDGKSEEGPKISEEEALAWSRRFKANGLNIKHYEVTHIGTQNLKNIISNFVAELRRYPNFDLMPNTQVVNVYSDDEKNSVSLMGGETITAKYIVFAVGKTGSDWMRNIFERYKIEYVKTQTYVGVRVETKHEYLKDLFKYSFDPKIWGYMNGHKVKTHCFCRHGDIICTNYMGFPIVGGHTRITKNNMPLENASSLGSFNILVSVNEPAEHILQTLNKFKLIDSTRFFTQKMEKFLNVNDITTDCIRTILNSLDGIGDYIADFIMTLDRIIPGISAPENMIYAPALEWFMDSVRVKPNMRTAHESWYAVGDGAGLSQGIVHSAATGIIAAEDICLRLGEKYVTT